MAMEGRRISYALWALCASLICTAAAADEPPLLPQTAAELLARVSDTTAVTMRGMFDNLGGDQVDGYQTVATLAGRSPDIWGVDFGFSTVPNEHVDLRPTIFPKAQALRAQGASITVSWHECNPVGQGIRPWIPGPEPCTFTSQLMDTNGDGVMDSWSNSVLSSLTNAQWNALLTDGTPLNMRWKAQIDKLAALLQQFQDANIPVLFRPYHEPNIPGFWWADLTIPEHFTALWRQLRCYLEETKGLTNLVWVWSVSYHPTYWWRVAEFYPGDDVVDVVGLDIYPPTAAGIPDFENGWNTLSVIAPGKPLALTEISRLPSDAELLARHWAYVVPWGKTLLFRDNTVARIAEFFAE